MLIREFMIKGYGPLAGGSKRVLSSFNLFFGPNEEGKTLTVDALLRLMAGRGALKSMGALKRVPGEPDGYILLLDHEGQERMFPAGGTVPGLAGVSADQFFSIFVIRDGDLSISADQGFFQSLTEKLTGIKSGEIDKICDSLLEMARLTQGGDFQNTTPLKLKDRMARGTLFLEKCEDLTRRLQEEGFERLDVELVEKKEALLRLEKRLELLHAAFKQERSESGKRAIGALQETLSALSELERFNEAALEQWRRLEISSALLQRERFRLEEELAELDSRRELTLASLKKLKLKTENLKRSLDRAGEELLPALNSFELRRERADSAAFYSDAPFARQAAYITLALVLFSLAGVIFNPSPWLYCLLGASFLGLIALAGLKLLALKRQRGLGCAARAVLRKAAGVGFSLSSPEKARAFLGRLERSCLQTRSALSEAGQEYAWLEREKSRLAGELVNLAAREKEESHEAESLRFALGVDSFEVLGEKLARKRELEKKRSGLSGALLGFLGEESAEDASFSELIERCEARLKELCSYAGAAPGLRYSEKEREQVQAAIASLREKIESLAEKTLSFNEKMRTLQKEAAEIFAPLREEPPLIQGAHDLDRLQKEARLLLDGLENERAAALAAIEAFKDLRAEEEQKVESLFEPGGPAGRYMAAITNGRYLHVQYESAARGLFVIDHQGRRFETGQLSGGACDQLFFSARLALAEKIFASKPGFLILDDPFVRADAGRLAEQIAILLGLSEKGWQIIYFSAKQEVLDVLAAAFQDGRVKLFSLA